MQTVSLSWTDEKVRGWDKLPVPASTERSLMLLGRSIFLWEEEERGKEGGGKR